MQLDGGTAIEDAESAFGIDFGNRRFGDCNGNGRIDGEDAAAFNDAFDSSSSGLGTGTYNICFDFEPDGDVDFSDLYEFQQLIGVPIGPPEPAVIDPVDASQAERAAVVSALYERRDRFVESVTRAESETDSHYVSLGDAEIVTGADFGNQPQGGSIHGTKWDDLNANGRRDDEPPLAGWTIYLDLNNNGNFDDDEPSEITNERGDYWFTDLPPGRYTVAEVVQEAWTQTFPANRTYVEFEDLGLGDTFKVGQTFTTIGTDGVPMLVTVEPFEFLDGTLFGSGFAQVDGSGLAGGTGQDVQTNNVNLRFDFAEPVAGLSVLFADQGGSNNLSINGDRRAVADLAELDGIVVGGATVRVTMFDNERGLVEVEGTISSFAIGGQEFWLDTLCRHAAESSDRPGVHVVDVVAGQRVVDRDFGNTRPGEIHGRKWLDANGDSEPGRDEPGLPGWRIYLDLNNNGQFDDGEPTTTTDQDGSYWFMDLPPGSYTVAEVPQPGWIQTFPSPMPSQDLFQFEDLDPSVTFDVGQVFTTIADAGAVANVTVQPFTFLNGQVTSDGSARARVVNLGNTPTQVLAPNNANVDFDFEETLSSLLLLFSDSGGNVNLRVNGELRNVSNLGSLDGQVIGDVLVNVTTVSDNFGILGLSGSIDAFAIGGQEFWIDNLVIGGAPVNGSGVHTVDVDSGEVVEPLDFGNRALRGSIHGTKFIDFNGDGIRGSNDRGAPGFTVYLDLNDNGQLDPEEPSTETNRRGDYWFMDLELGTYTVREVVPEGWTQTAPIVTFEGADYEVGEQPAAVATGDVTGDGVADMVLADAAGGAVLVLPGNGDGSFGAAQRTTVDGFPLDVELVDLEDDGDLDVVVPLGTKQRLAVLRNAGDGTFAVSLFETGAAPFMIAVSDFNQDGLPDVAAASVSTGSVFVHLGDGSGGLLDPQQFAVGAGSIDVVAADFNHDDVDDLAVLNRTDGTISILQNRADGTGGFDPVLTLPVIAGASRLVVSDFDQDGNLDLAVASPADDQVGVYFGTSSASELIFEPIPVTLPGLSAGQGLAAADINQDALPDLVATHLPDSGDNEIWISLSNGDRTFRGPVREAVGANPFAVAIADVNDDGRPDIVTADAGRPGATVLLQGPAYFYVVTLVDEEPVEGRDFGNFGNGRITGTKFEGNSCEQSIDVAGFTIYLDIDEDGELDADEPFAVTDAAGDYEIANIPPGTYSVREVVTAPYAQSFPETGRHIVTISQTNQTVSGIDFGNFIHTPLPDGADFIYGFGADDTLWGDNVVSDPCILSLGDDDHLFGMAGDDFLAGQLRNDTYYFGPAPETADEIDTIEELEDGGTNERFDEGIFDRLNFDGHPIKEFDGLGPDESVTVDLSGASPVFVLPNEVAEHSRPGSATHFVVTNLADQFQFVEQIVGGQADDTLVGNDRDNLLDGRDGSDLEFGAAGDDTYVFVPGQPGDIDHLVETIGLDTLDFSQIPDAVTADLATPPIFTTAPVIAVYGAESVESPMPGLFENIIGTDQADTLRGSAEGNRLVGGGEADLLIGLAGDDTLEGGPGSDRYAFEDDFGVDEVLENVGEGPDDVMDFSAVTVPLDFVIGMEIQVSDGAGGQVTHPGLNVEQILGGSSLNDTLTSGDGPNTWLITGVDSGLLNGVAFQDIENLQGGSGPDTFLFGPGGALTGSIDGGGGDDVFDFAQGGTVGGTILGAAGSDMLVGDDADRTWTISGIDAGTASGIGPFVQVENLTGGAGVDTFTLAGGQLTGQAGGGAGQDVLGADNIATTFTLTGPDAGMATGVGTGVGAFASIERLAGGNQDDRFELILGSSSGAIDGGLGSDTLMADDVETTFTLTGADTGFATGVSQFFRIQNLTGNNRADQFVFDGGSLTGDIEGGGGFDTIVADNVANQFVVTSTGAGTATGIDGSFTDVENLTGSAQDDTLTLLGGSLQGTFRGEGGSDTIEADNVANQFATFGPNTGFLTGPGSGLGLFVGVETLVGNTSSDTFRFFLAPFAGSIDGQGGDDTLVGGGQALTFNITGLDSGDVDAATMFASIERLAGGSAGDTFFFTGGGTLSGPLVGGAGSDTLVADPAVATTFDITGPDSGTLAGTSVVPFSEIENLTGSQLDDSFLINGGSLSGIVGGGAGSDTLTADNTFNLFEIDQVDGGQLTNLGGFAQIENLIGNSATDVFWLTGGQLNGTVDGAGGTNLLGADNVPNQFLVDGPNRGQVTGVGGGFANIQHLWGGTMADEFVVESTGSLDGSLVGREGDDRFELTPALGSLLDIRGGTGTDELVIDAQDGVPAELLGMVVIAPGGATITHTDVETVTLLCDTCGIPSVVADESVYGPLLAPTGVSSFSGQERLSSFFGGGWGLAARATESLSTGSLQGPVDVGHFSTSRDVRIGFVDMARAMRRLSARSPDVVRTALVDRVFATSAGRETRVDGWLTRWRGSRSEAASRDHRQFDPDDVFEDASLLESVTRSTSRE
ncbi:MAG: FG-GAP-like repeat-containing protein [Pirellulales bacterium]